jgi:hypothetical protein
MRLRAGPCARPPSLVDRTTRSLPLVDHRWERPRTTSTRSASPSPHALQLARSGFDELQVLGQGRRAVSRMRMPLTRHERMFASMRPHPDCPRSSRSSKGPQKTALESQRPRRSETFVQCRRRDSNPRHAPHDSHLIWLNHREFWAAWTHGWTHPRIRMRPIPRVAVLEVPSCDYANPRGPATITRPGARTRG